MELVKKNGKVMIIKETMINLNDMKFHRTQLQGQLNKMDSDINEIEEFGKGQD